MKVSVSLQTYQQVDTIRQAAESTLMQETDFPFEVIAGDDASTDGTAEILRELAETSQGQLKPLIAASNPGDFGFTNMASTMRAATGEYIALLDGDDYWIARDKLQTQVDFLDAHPECNICAHRVIHRRSDGTQFLSPSPPSGDGIYDVGQLVARNFVPKISTVFRRSALLDIPEWYWNVHPISADWVMNVLVCRNAKVGYIDRVMAIRNLHEGGVSTRHGPRGMLHDKLRILDLLSDSMPEERRAIARSKRLVQMKLLLTISPRLFDTAKNAVLLLGGRRLATAKAADGVNSNAGRS